MELWWLCAATSAGSSTTQSKQLQLVPCSVCMVPCVVQYGTPFWTKIRSHGAILSPVDVPRSSIAVPRSSTYVPRSSIYVPRPPIAVTRPSIHFPRTLHVPRSQIAVTRPSIQPSTFLDPRSSTLDPTYLHPVLQTGFHCAFPLEQQLLDPTLLKNLDPRLRSSIIDPLCKQSAIPFALLRMRSLNDTRGRALMAAERRRGYRSSSSAAFNFLTSSAPSFRVIAVASALEASASGLLLDL